MQLIASLHSITLHITLSRKLVKPYLQLDCVPIVCTPFPEGRRHQLLRSFGSQGCHFRSVLPPERHLFEQCLTQPRKCCRCHISGRARALKAVWARSKVKPSIAFARYECTTVTRRPGALVYMRRKFVHVRQVSHERNVDYVDRLGEIRVLKVPAIQHWNQVQSSVAREEL